MYDPSYLTDEQWREVLKEMGFSDEEIEGNIRKRKEDKDS